MQRDNLLLGLMGMILLVGIVMTMQYTGYVIIDDTTVAFDWNETWDINGSFVRVSQGANVYDRDTSELLIDSQVVVSLLDYNLTTGLVYVDLVVDESVVDSESLNYMLFGALPEEIIEVLPEVNESEPEEPEEVLEDQEDILEPQDATNPPSHTAPTLNATSAGNYTTDNLTLFNQTTADLDGDVVKNIINWYRNSTSLTVVNMPFEGGSNNTFAKDYSPYGNNISAYVADPVWNRTGGYDGFGAFEFDGTTNEFILIDNVTNLNFDMDTGEQFSIELRAKHFDTSTEQYFLNKGINAADKSNYRVYLGNNDKVIYRIQNGTESSAMAGTNAFELGTWYHVVLTVNQTAMVGYVNGEIDVNTSHTLTGRIGTSGHMFIGNINAVDSPLNGSLDELRIWNRSLSHQQVRALYQNNTDLIVSQETLLNETWNATMTPNDGYIDGETLWSNDIIVLAANNVPTVSANVTSSSSLNYSNGTLVGAWEFTDGDSDVEQDNETRWWKNGVENTTFANYTSIESSNLTKGEVWNFSVRSYDGVDWSIWSSNSSITLVNALPEHATPLLNSTLGTNYSSANLTVWNQSTSDLDGDRVCNVINWYRNDTSILLLNMPFEGGSNNSFAKDYSPYGNNITAADNPLWNRTGGYDGRGAFEFNSADENYLIIANNTLLNYNMNMGGALTVELWFKNVQNGEDQYIFSKGKGGGIVSAYYVYLKTQYLLYRIENETDSLSMVGTQLIVDDAWNHLVFVMNNSAMTGYINGEWDKGVVHNMTGTLGSSDAFFLGNHFSGSKPLNGSIDNFRIWNLSLSHEQIRALYNNRTDLIVSQTTKRNEVWNASITVNDGYIDGETLYTEGLTILNAPPAIPRLNLSSTDANNYTNSSLFVNWSEFDADGDSIINNETKWWRDGVENTTFANNTWIESANFTADEVWNVSRRVYDGSNWSQWSENASIVLQETPYMLSYTIPYVYDNDSAVDLNITTSKDSDCQYKNGTMNWTFFTDTGLRTHGVITGIDSYGIYTYYVRCNDSANTFVNDTLSFAVVKTIPNGLGKDYEKVNFTANESQTINFKSAIGLDLVNLTLTTASNISNAYVKYLRAEYTQQFEGSSEGLLNGQSAKYMLVVDENLRDNITNSTWYLYHGAFSDVIAGPYILQFNISNMEWEILQTTTNVEGSTAINTTNYRTIMFAALTNSTGDADTGSSGSGEGAVEAEVEIEEEEEEYEEECGDLIYLNYDYLYKDEMVEMEIYDPCIGLLYVEFTPNKNINGTSVTFYRERNDESNQYLGFDVSPSNMVDNDIGEMNFVFSIDKDWADANTESSCSLENLGVESEEGEEYYASYVDEDDSYYYFVSPYIEEFGVYHISAFECPNEPSIIEEITEAITGAIEEERELREKVTEASKSLFWVLFTLVVCNLLVYYLMKLILIFKWNKKKYYDEDIKVESKRVGNVGMLKYYLIFNMAQAKDMNKLKINLMKEGWDINMIERVLLKVRDVPKDRLALFIYSKLAANFNEQALVNVLVEKGWEESRVRKLILLFRNI